jgi:hypothetical protein
MALKPSGGNRMSSGHTPPPGAAPPIELVVTTGGDMSDPNDGVLTLREAVADQATAGVSARISFVPGIDEVVLTQGELLINGTSAATGAVLTIDGGAGGLTLTQDVAGGSRVVHIDGASSGVEQAVVLNDVTITGGLGTTEATAYGAGLLGRTATITLDDVAITGNRLAAGGQGVAGGGLALEECTTTITGGAITDNTVVASAGYASGGGIFASGGSLRLSGTEVSGNSATSAVSQVFGGGIAVTEGTEGSAVASLDHVTVARNTASVTGGTAYAAGGGISALGQSRLTLSYATLDSNTAKGAGSAYGGGVFGTYRVMVAYSLITANVAEASDKAFGGGIAMHREASNLSVLNSTVASNTLNAARGYGAGVEVNGSIVEIGSATIVGNSVGDAPGVGGIDISRASSADILNSIIAQNSGTTTDVAGTIESNGHNLFSQLDIVGQQPGDIVTLDAKLAAIADKGGPTMTMALLPGSLALDAGLDGDAIGKTDQRGTGFARISGGHTDIGAFETQQAGGVERLFTPGDDVVDLRGVDLALLPGALGTRALAGNDTIRLSTTQNRGETFRAGRGDDVVIGGSAGDRIAGELGDDRLFGSGRADFLRGGPGDDILHGRRGFDELHGGADADRFVYTDVRHAPHGTVRFDEILDFSRREGDRIDLRGIDAAPGMAGDQRFIFVGRGPLDEVGELRARALGDGDFLVSGQLERDASPEFSILVRTEDDLGRLERGDFLL